ncbi:hypothetical protein DPMN_143608 [Dreissena polymorpha]|uniref:Uncharacterized protein n=2 Tax=Dreissena polymorpha TaxID=45954 RepID=A0A9D4JLU3_DREPO|nr:hypothetical protein DPMN_143608 [Dreissena polymorpha]
MSKRKRDRSPPIVKSITAQVVPAVTQFILKTLTDMGVTKPANANNSPSGSNSQVQSDTVSQLLDLFTLTTGPQSDGRQTSMNSIPIQPLSPAPPQGISLSAGVDPKLKAKIWADQFLALASLINSKESGTLCMKHNPDVSIALHRSEAEDIKNMEAWHKAWTIFVAIYTERQPTSAPALMKYSATIQHLAKQAGVYSAIQYDVQFRKIKEDAPSVHLGIHLTMNSTIKHLQKV